VNEPISNSMLSRRHILAGAAALGAGLVIAACGSDSNDAGAPSVTGGSSGTTGTTGGTTATTDTMAPTTGSMAPNVDLKVAMLAASLEVLAVGTYQAALAAATAGSLGAVPAAVGEFVTVSMGQHQMHLDKWNTVITGAGGAAVTEPNATLKPTVDAAFAKVTDVAGAASLALMLEQIASATYLSAQNVLTDPAAIQLAGSIQIVDAQHVAILLYVLGEYPVPDVFAKVEMAAAA
jgi:hypothetical protein